MAAELTEEQQAALDELKASAGASEDAPMEVTTAFLVVQHKNGQWSAHADYDEMALITDRKAHMDDFVGGAANVSLSCQVQQSAMHTLVAMNQQAQAMQQQMESQKIAQSLKLR